MVVYSYYYYYYVGEQMGSQVRFIIRTAERVIFSEYDIYGNILLVTRADRFQIWNGPPDDVLFL